MSTATFLGQEVERKEDIFRIYLTGDPIYYRHSSCGESVTIITIVSKYYSLSLI